MNLLFSILIGLLFAAGLYLLMSKSVLRLVAGFMILSQALNVLLLVGGGLKRDSSPMIPDDVTRFPESPEALAQAVILTAIVISFAATAFLISLVKRSQTTFETDDVEKMGVAE